MTSGAFRGLLIVGLSAIGVWAVGCEGDPPKHSVYAGGEGGLGEGGETPSSTRPVNGAGRSNDAGTSGALGVAGAGGAPSEAVAQGGASLGGAGTPTNAGAPQLTAGAGNEPSAGAGNEPTGGAPGTACQGELFFGDSNFEQSLRRALDIPTGPITDADVATLTSFKLDSIDGTIDISGIECLTALTELDFSDNALGTPLSALAALPNLTTLDLSGDYLDGDSIADLSQLTQLSQLDLSDNDLTALEPLSTLVNLKSLSLHDTSGYLLTPIDLTPLAGMTELQELSLDYNVLSSLTPLAGLTKLQTLSLIGAGISDVTPLADMAQLTSLDVSDNQITDVTTLGALPAIQSLTISNNPVASLAPLSASAYMTTGVVLFAENLNCTTFATDFATLSGKGVDVHTTCD